MPSFRGTKNCASCKYWKGERTISKDVVTVKSAVIKGICTKKNKETKAEHSEAYCSFERVSK